MTEDRRPEAGSPVRADTPRVASIDLLRGLVMIVMALDHVRDFTNRNAMAGSPTDLATTTSAIFFTRWVTHICAPAFALTAGIAAWLWWNRNRDRRALASFLTTRGIWLIALEIGVMQFAYYFAWPSGAPVLLLVLWSLGLSMILLAGLAWLPRAALLILGLGAILLHPLLDGVQAGDLGPAGPIWNIVHQVGAFQLGAMIVATPYPLVPWAGVMALGFALGPVFVLPEVRRAKIFFSIGATLVVAFAALRLANGYGDPVPWTSGANLLWTTMSFLNVSKYPASPAFLLLTLGLAFGLLGIFERTFASFEPRGVLRTLGSVPLFFYLLHFFVAHFIASALWLGIYGPRAWAFLFLPYPSFGGDRGSFPSDFGLPLWGSYLVWVAVLAVTYPLCRLYARAKAGRNSWWMRYL